jgi:RimJ/RimL family protein N-acetyltransferase
MDIPVEPIVFYAMHPNYRNQHHMEQALSVVIQFMVSKRFCSFVKTEVDADNIKSVKVLESAKFHFVQNNEPKSMYIKKLI